MRRAQETIDIAAETGEIHWEVWDNRNIRRDNTRFPIPFYHAIEGVTVGLEDLLVLMASAETGDRPVLQKLFAYTTALSRPHRRISLFDDKLVTFGYADTAAGHETYLDSSKMITDPITSFNHYARDLLMVYSRGDTLFGGTVAKDQFLMWMMHKLLNSRTFSSEGLNAASDEMVTAMRHSLNNLQAMYRVDAEGMVREYACILEAIQGEVVDRDSVFKEIRPGHRRHIFSLEEQAQGKFRITKGVTEEDFGQETVREAYQVRQEITSGTDPVAQLLVQFAQDNKPWSSYLSDVIALVRARNSKPIDLHTIVEYDKKGTLVRAEYAKVSMAEVIGQEENVKHLGRLLYAFGEGKRIPNIVLYGKPGRGKTMSIRALADCHPRLRTILLSYADISGLGKVIEQTTKLPYQIVAYVDDMHFPDGFDIEHFKTKTCGVKDDWPSNFALVVSVNPEAFDHLPESMRDRFGVRLNYTRCLDKEQWKEVFRVTAKHEGLEYSDMLWGGFFRAKGIEPTDETLGKLNGRMVRDYMREQAAMKGVEFPQGLR